MYSVPLLEHHPSGEETPCDEHRRDDAGSDDYHRGKRYGGRTYLHFQRHVLVLCRRGRGLRLFIGIHGYRVLAHTEMGRPCRRAAQRPLAGAHNIHDRSVYRCSLAEPSLRACHRAGLLLPPFPQRQPQGLAHSVGHLVCHCGSDTLRRGAWHHHRWRMVRTLLREHSRHAVQLGHNSLFHTAHRHCALGNMGDIYRPQQETSEHCLHSICRYARNTFLQLRMEGILHWYYRSCHPRLHT